MSRSTESRGVYPTATVSPQRGPNSLKRILELKHFHNTLLPISRLPVEILRAIFRESARSVISPGLSTWGRLRLIAICHSWRVIARSDQSLWTDIDCTEHQDLVRMFWQLSHPLPASVSIYGNSGMLKPWVRNLRINWNRVTAMSSFIFISGAHRIKNLEVDIPTLQRFSITESPSDQVLSVLVYLRPTLALSNLRSVSLSAQYDYGHSMYPQLFEDFQLLKGGVNPWPLVESLKLSAIKMGSIAFLQSWSLRVLHITFWGYYGIRGHIQGWRTLLQHLAQHLEELKLETHALPDFLDSDPRFEAPVDMFKLRGLLLSLPKPHHVMTFLNNIRFVLSSVAKIEVSTNDASLPSWDSIASFLNRHHSKDESTSFRLEMTHNSVIFHSLDEKATVAFTSTFWNTDVLANIDELTLDHLDPTLQAQVVDLHIGEEFRPAIEFSEAPTAAPPWEAFAKSFSNLRALTIATGPYLNRGMVWQWDSMMCGLDPEIYHDIFNPRNIHSTLLTKLADPDRALNWFPVLRDLHFKGHRLERVTNYDGESQLLMFLKHRFDSSNPIERIILDGNCRISSIFRHSIAHVSPTTVIEQESRQKKK